MNRKAYYNQELFETGNIVWNHESRGEGRTPVYGVVLDSDNSFGHAPSYRVLWRDGSVSHRVEPWDLEIFDRGGFLKGEIPTKQESKHFQEAIQCESHHECVISKRPKLNHEDLLDFRLGRKL